MKENYTMGLDPEFMALQNGRIVSSIPLMKGSKYDKEELGKGFAAYSDNVNIECNVPPSDSPKKLVGNLKKLFDRLKKKHPEFSIVTQASHEFTVEECEHDLAKEFGCNPEFDVYAEDVVNPPEGGNTFRSAGGHIHLGNKTFQSKESQGYLLDFKDKCEAIKLMDLYVGIPLVLMDNDPTSPARKKLYGKAGRFRPTNYGVEYRTPSPYWLTNPRIASLTAELTFMVMQIGDSNQGAGILADFDLTRIKEAVDTNDKMIAMEIFEKLNLPDEIRQTILEISQEQLNQEVYENWK